jgi:hypothetical protein
VIAHDVSCSFPASPTFRCLCGAHASLWHIGRLAVISSREKQEEAVALARHLFGSTNIRFFSPTETSPLQIPLSSLHPAQYHHNHHPPHKHCRISPALHFNMRFSLATLATVALATQTATADWLSGKAGKSSLMARPIWA